MSCLKIKNVTLKKVTILLHFFLFPHIFIAPEEGTTVNLCSYSKIEKSSFKQSKGSIQHAAS